MLFLVAFVVTSGSVQQPNASAVQIAQIQSNERIAVETARQETSRQIANDIAEILFVGIVAAAIWFGLKNHQQHQQTMADKQRALLEAEAKLNDAKARADFMDLLKKGKVSLPVAGTTPDFIEGEVLGETVAHPFGQPRWPAIPARPQLRLGDGSDDRWNNRG